MNREPKTMKTLQIAQSGSLHSACSALIRVCDTCGKINAIDLDASPEAERDMQELDHTVKRVTREEAMEAWRDAGRCDHKGLVESLRAQLAVQNESSADTAGVAPRHATDGIPPLSAALCYPLAESTQNTLP